MADIDPRSELLELTRALRANAEWLRASGASGLDHASAELRAERLPEHDQAPRHDAKPETPAPAPAAASVRPAPAPVSAVAAPAKPELAAEARGPIERLGGEARAKRLALLAEEVRSCTRCGLHAQRTQTVFARGTGSARLCFVGEAPGQDEDEQGEPFVGAAGQLLDKMITAMGLGRDEVYVCNILKCRPPKNRKPEADEMATCMPFLVEQFELIQPDVIVALGGTAVEGLLGNIGGITRVRGSFRLYRGRIPVMPTFHPAYLLRTPSAKRQVWEDLQAVLRQMGRSLPAKKP
jgi:DNA polymerase